MDHLAQKEGGSSSEINRVAVRLRSYSQGSRQGEREAPKPKELLKEFFNQLRKISSLLMTEKNKTCEKNHNNYVPT